MFFPGLEDQRGRGRETSKFRILRARNREKTLNLIMCTVWSRMDRHIVACFLYHFWDEVHVLKNAHKLQGKPYWIHEQFPNEIKDKRRLLYPNTKTCRKAGQRTKIVKDKLFIDGKLYEPHGSSVTPKSAKDGSLTKSELSVLSFVDHSVIIRSRVCLVYHWL